MQSEKAVVDVTNRVTCYEKGKVFECRCGQGFGVKFNVESVRCPTCGKVCVDELVDEREPPEREQGQSKLGDWG